MIPTQQMPGKVAYQQHAAYFDEGCDKGRAAYAFKLIEAELQT